ncbi:MAG: hypothetical protein LCH46_07290 [Proteobacteria bacterium]|nr:hypothetical protein [Pseudomonadota bacterium]
MPFETETVLPARQLRPGDPLAPSPSFGETMKAAFRQDNLVGSAMTSEALRSKMDGDFYTVDRSYNPFADDNLKGYEDHIDAFTNVFNAKAAKLVKADIDRETRDRQTLAASGWMGFGLSAGASILDPTMLIPAGAVVRGAKGAYSVGKSALKLGTAAGVATAVQEAGLQATQQTRPGAESALAIGGSVLLGALLGGGISKVMTFAERKAAGDALKAAEHPEFDAVTDELHKELTAMVPRPGAAPDPAGASSMGAAASQADTLDDLSIAGIAGSAQAKATAQLNPMLRTMQSPSKAVREISSALMEVPIYLKKNFAGRGDAAAETATHEWTRGAVSQAMEAQEKYYVALRKSGTVMTRPEFREAIGRAMRRGDRADIPQVAEAARSWRSTVIDPLKERAIAAGLLPEDVHVDTADSYFTRVWNKLKIEANEAEFRNIVKTYLGGALDAATEAEAQRMQRKLGKLKGDKDRLEKSILNRDANMLRRLETGEISADDLDEEAIVEFVRRVNAGEKPPQVESLSKWLNKQGGVFDPEGLLTSVYPEARRIPGLLRKERRTKLNAAGGEGIDDLALRAWQEGFFDGAERPTIREFIDAMAEDVRGRRVIRAGDREAAASADAFDQMMQAMDRMGVDFARPLFGTSDSLKDLAMTANKVISDLDRERIAKLDADIAHAGQRGQFDFLSPEDRDAYLEDIVQSIYEKVTGRFHEGDTPTSLIVTKRGPLAERTFHIPDKLVEKYLDDDAEWIGRRYARVMSADIELKQRFGSVDMKQAIDAIRQDYAALKAAAENSVMTPEAKAKHLADLNRRERNDVRDISAVRDMLRGNYRPELSNTAWARTLNAAMTFNYLTSLGGVTVSSLTDVVRPAMVHGLKAFMKDGLGPLIRRSKGLQMSKQEATLAGAISEKILHSRLATLAELTDPYSQSKPWERFLQNASVGFTRLTGLLHFNDFMKSVSATMTQNRILQNAEVAAERGFAALDDRERAYMGLLGIGQDRAELLGRLFKEHGDVLEGVRVANSDQWPDDLDWLRSAWRAAINKDVDRIIVTKSLGDTPLFAQTATGRALLQFRTFALASNQRVLIMGLQEDTTRFVGGVMGMATIGMFIYWLKQLESGREISDNPGTWIAEGLDRSGIFSLAFEVNNAIEKAGGPGIYSGAAALFPNASQRAPASRFAVRSKVGSFLGPTFSTATDAVTLLASGLDAMGKVAQGEAPDFVPADVESARRLTPFASLPYWRWLVDGMIVPELKEEAAK